MQERYTKQAENVLALAKEAASSCGHSYIGTEHLLVGLVEEKEGTAGRVLEEFGIQADKAIALIDKLIAPPRIFMLWFIIPYRLKKVLFIFTIFVQISEFSILTSPTDCYCFSPPRKGLI